MNFFSFERRQLLITQMSNLEKRGVDCYSCHGVCCTFVANSMQVTPLEALELYLYLVKELRWTEKLVDTLNQCIKKYRLNVEIQTHRHQQMRKTYTCPFFQEGQKGCSISRAVKPYGCLGFNPQRANCVGEGGCCSLVELLEQREHEWHQEQQVNEYIKQYLQLSWNKLDISRGLLDIAQVDLNDTQFFADVGRLLGQ